jgi:hypothetical protein
LESWRVPEYTFCYVIQIYGFINLQQANDNTGLSFNHPLTLTYANVLSAFNRAAMQFSCHPSTHSATTNMWLAHYSSLYFYTGQLHDRLHHRCSTPTHVWPIQIILWCTELMSYFYNNNSIYINMIFQLQFVYLDTRISITVQANRNGAAGVCISFGIKYYITVGGKCNIKYVSPECVGT